MFTHGTTVPAVSCMRPHKRIPHPGSLLVSLEQARGTQVPSAGSPWRLISNLPRVTLPGPKILKWLLNLTIQRQPPGICNFRIQSRSPNHSTENFRIGSSSASNSITHFGMKGAMKSIRSHVLKIQSESWALGQDSSQMPLNTVPTRSVLPLPKYTHRRGVNVSICASSSAGVQFKFWLSHLVESLEKKLLAYDGEKTARVWRCFLEPCVVQVHGTHYVSGSSAFMIRTHFCRRQRKNECAQKYSA